MTILCLFVFIIAFAFFAGAVIRFAGQKESQRLALAQRLNAALEGK